MKIRYSEQQIVDNEHILAPTEHDELNNNIIIDLLSSAFILQLSLSIVMSYC